jgi:hypothetical protein
MAIHYAAEDAAAAEALIAEQRLDAGYVGHLPVYDPAAKTLVRRALGRTRAAGSGRDRLCPWRCWAGLATVRPPRGSRPMPAMRWWI